MEYIATEQEDLRTEKARRSKEEARLRGRFGVGLGGLSEEEALKYAEIMSAEAFQKDEERRTNDAGYLADSRDSFAIQSDWSTSQTVTPEGSVQGNPTSSPPTYKTDEELDQDLEEAIRLSLLDGVDSSGRSPRGESSGTYEVPITYRAKRSRRSACSSPSTSQASRSRAAMEESGGGTAVAADDLDFALQLSLAEERSRMEENAAVEEGDGKDEFPSLESPVVGKGKGRAH